MPFPSEIQAALQIYDDNKGFWRRLFHRDQAAIRALHRLNESDQSNILMIYRCFIMNKPKDKQESYKVYKTFLDYLVQEEYSSIPETLDQLYNNKLLTLSNLNKLQRLSGYQFSQLASLFRLLNIRGLLIQDNFDNISEYLNKDKDNKLTNFINLVILLGEEHLNQANLNWLLKKPLLDESVILILKVLAGNSLLTSKNNLQFLDEKNQFLLSKEAYSMVWNPIENHLRTLNIEQKQSIFDTLISLTHEEDSISKIQNFINPLIPETAKQPRRRTNVIYSTAPQRSKNRGSLSNLVFLQTRTSTL